VHFLISLLKSSVIVLPLVAYLNYILGKSDVRFEYRKNRIGEWYSMVNGVHKSYPSSRFENWDQYPSLESFLSTNQIAEVSSLEFCGKDLLSNNRPNDGNLDPEFMSVIRMLKKEISRIERDVWKLI
jgi:hypothetical protein